jgi:hypothetical protein
VTLEGLEGRICPSDFYTYTTIAVTGQADQYGFPLTGIESEASINDAGQVAFVGDYANGQGILVGGGRTPNNINSFSGHISNLDFLPYVDMNNNNQVVAIDEKVGPVPEYNLRTWPTTPANSPRLIATGGYTPQAPPTKASSWNEILSSPAINDDGDVAFPALNSKPATPPTDSLNLSLSGGGTNTAVPLTQKNPLRAPQILRPQISNNDDVVVQEGPASTGPIVLFDLWGNNQTTIADTTDFKALGRSPGISSDGQIVVFAATVNDQGGARFGIPTGTSAVFASVETNGTRALVPITYFAANGPNLRFPVIYPGGNNGQSLSPIKDINLNASISVNSTQTTQRAVTIVYDGYEGTGTNEIEGIYTSRLNFFGKQGNGSGDFDPANPASFTVGIPTQVVQVGDTDIKGLGAVTGFNLFESVNSRDRGDVAFWVTDGTNEAIVRARPQEVVYLDFYPVESFSLNPTVSQLFTQKLGNPMSVWAGDFDSVFSGLTGRPDLSGASNLAAIEDNITTDVRDIFNNAQINVYVESSRNVPTAPSDGPVTTIYIGAAGSDVRRDLDGQATGVDLFNQGLFDKSGRGGPFEPLAADAAVIFANNVFSLAAKNFSEALPPFQRGKYIDLTDDGAGKITATDVATAVADVVAHETGHTMGLVHIANSFRSDVMHENPSADPYLNGTMDQLRTLWSFGTTSLPASPPEFKLGMQNDKQRLALTVGSYVDPLVLHRDEPDPNAIGADNRSPYSLSANLSGASVQVTDAVVGIIPLGLAVDDVMPEIVDLGPGSLATLLSQTINAGPEDQIIILASTNGQGVNVFSTASGFTGSVAAINSTNILEDLSDPDLRGNLYDANGSPSIASLNLYECRRSRAEPFVQSGRSHRG